MSVTSVGWNVFVFVAFPGCRSASSSAAARNGMTDALQMIPIDMSTVVTVAFSIAVITVALQTVRGEMKKKAVSFHFADALKRNETPVGSVPTTWIFDHARVMRLPLCRDREWLCQTLFAMRGDQRCAGDCVLRPRGGGASDACVGDTLSDLELDYDAFGDSHRPRMEMVAHLVVPMEDGSLWTAACTTGDGTCALHSVWGVPTRTNIGTELFACDARPTIVGSTPDDHAQFLGGPFELAFVQLLHDRKTEVAAYARTLQRGDEATPLQARSSSVVWEHMCAEVQKEARRFADEQLVAEQARKQWEAAAQIVAEELFLDRNRELVRRLCVQLGHIPQQRARRLGSLVEDVAHDEDRLELFRDSERCPGKSKFEFLFHAGPGAVSLRREFFSRRTAQQLQD